jgi:hypothetical protein
LYSLAQCEAASGFWVTGSGILIANAVTAFFGSATQVDPAITLPNVPLEVGNLTFDGGATSLISNGQLIIGDDDGRPKINTLTPGTGIKIENGAGSIKISTTGSGFSWVDSSGTFTASVNTGYFLTAASTVTLPPAPVQGDAFEVICDTAGSCVVTANTGQSIRISNQLSSVAGSATNTAIGDSLSLVFRSATNTWFADASPNGGWTTA